MLNSEPSVLAIESVFMVKLAVPALVTVRVLLSGEPTVTGIGTNPFKVVLQFCNLLKYSDKLRGAIRMRTNLDFFCPIFIRS